MRFSETKNSRQVSSRTLQRIRGQFVKQECMAKIVIIVILGIIFAIVSVWSSINSSLEEYEKFQNERNKKYRDRKIDVSKSLFDRNLDIIQDYALKIGIGNCSSIQELTHDCLREICLAENTRYCRPNVYGDLSSWKKTATLEWGNLASNIEDHFQKAKKLEKEKQAKELLDKERFEKEQLKNERLKREQQAEKERLDLQQRQIRQIIYKEQIRLEKLAAHQTPPEKFREVIKRVGHGHIFLETICSILEPNVDTWKDKEQQLIDQKFVTETFPIFTSSTQMKEAKSLNEKIAQYNKSVELDIPKHEENSAFFEGIRNGFQRGVKQDVLQRIDYILNDIEFPNSIPKLWDSDYDPEQSILVVEINLPDVVHSPIFKKVELKSKTAEKPLTKREIQEYVPKIHPAIMLRVAYEIFVNDESGTIKLLVLNGWVEYDNPATGKRAKTYTSSLGVTRDQILKLTLSKLDPHVAFVTLKGKSAGALIDIIPITPTMSLNRKDKRFIETREILNNIGDETNLASMDWQDFESLIAELFEKEFAEKGAEVKVTQSSRDRGVDAVIFDPDPIKGGKFVIQAKRYTKTVDVSAVRDLCAVVRKEGGSRGILVTTSSYGTDAYTFAQNEPITLLNGAELLGLLEKHGYKFRINISEARKLLKTEQDNES